MALSNRREQAQKPGEPGALKERGKAARRGASKNARRGLSRSPRSSEARPLPPPYPPIVSATHSVLDRLRACGLKLTPQRMAIVRELAADPTHPTAQELFERLRPSLPTMSFATVYNTLDALARSGLCAALSLAPGPARFDANMNAHHHAVCDRCGLVRDVAPSSTCASPRAHETLASSTSPTSPTPQASDPSAPSSAHDAHDQRAPLPSGFDVRAVEMIYRGLCAECAKASAPRGKRSLVTERTTNPRR